MCGIVAYVGRDNAWPIIYEGLKRLEYRGYDSAGIAVVDDSGALHLRKTVGRVSGLDAEINGSAPRGSLGLGHTRWATHGPPSRANAHPHTDCNSRVVLVHNGIVENYLELKRRLTAAGHVFRSETDTEALSHLVEEGLSLGLSFEDAFRRMGRMVQGSSAITATLQGEDGPICALRLGYAGGIVVAHHKDEQGQGQGIVASDLPALLPVLERGPGAPGVGFLEAGEMAVLNREGVRYCDLSGNPIVKELRRVSRDDVVVDKGGYRHFMLKEIMDQPQAMAAALRERADFANGRVELPGFPLSPSEVGQLERVLLIGCGTSLHAAQVGRHYIERLAGIPAEAESASEFRYRDPIIGPRTLVVSIGQSGETADTVAAMHLAREKGATLVAICNAEESQAARIADGALYMRAGLEVGVASTKTFIASLTILHLLAVYLGGIRGRIDLAGEGRLVSELARGPPTHRRTAGRRRLIRGTGHEGRPLRQLPVPGPGGQRRHRFRGRPEAQGNQLHPRRGLPGGRDEARPHRADRPQDVHRRPGPPRRVARQDPEQHQGSEGPWRRGGGRPDRRRRGSGGGGGLPAVHTGGAGTVAADSDDSSVATAVLPHRATARLRRGPAAKSGEICNG